MKVLTRVSHFHLKCADLKELQSPIKFISGLIYPASMEIHTKTNLLVDKITKIMFFFITWLSVPSFILPKFFGSFFIYFTTDIGSDAFELPLPMWYVRIWFFKSNRKMLIDIRFHFAVTQKDPIWLEKPHGIFADCFISARECLFGLLFCRIIGVLCNRVFHSCSFVD